MSSVRRGQEGSKKWVFKAAAVLKKIQSVSSAKAGGESSRHGESQKAHFKRLISWFSRLFFIIFLFYLSQIG